jgi:hypothetical protein
VVSDRWSAYVQWPLRKRQLCWAHLKRDFHFIAEPSVPTYVRQPTGSSSL